MLPELAVAATILASAEGSRVLEPKTEAQATALRSTAPEFCYSGRRLGGKSWVLCAKGFTYASLYPGARILIAREERATMDATTLYTLREEVCQPELWSACWKEAKSDLVLPNGSVIHVRGLDRPERILGLRVGFCGIDQAEQLDDLQYELANSCVMQVGMPWHQMFAAFNPEGPGHWAYKRFLPDDGDGFRKDRDGKVFAEVCHVAQEDLVDLLTPEARARFDRMTGVLRNRLRLGLWSASEGLVYCPPWDPQEHVVDKPESWSAWDGYPPPDWPRYRGFDFGYEPDPFVAQWWAEGPGRKRYLYREHVQTRLNMEQAAEVVLQYEREEMEALRRCAASTFDAETGLPWTSQYAGWLESFPVAASYSDHQKGERAMLAARGVATYPAQKDVTAGIACMVELMNPAQPGGPKVLVVKGSRAWRDQALVDRKEPTSFAEEVVGYEWSDTEVGARKGLPKKGKDHCLDAARYVHFSLETYGRAGVY